MSQLPHIRPSVSAVSVPATACRLCKIFQADARSPGVDTPWLSDGVYSAVVSVGALVPGWTLLSPAQHHTNMLPAYAESNFWSFASVAEKFIRARYGAVRIFEHGPNAAESLTGCGTGHAHMHLVPLDFSLEAESLSFDQRVNWTPCIASEISKCAAGQEYLFVADNMDGPNTRGMLCLLDESTSQFFRRVIADRLGLADFYDYRRYPMLEIVESSSIQLSADVARTAAEKNLPIAVV